MLQSTRGVKGAVVSAKTLYGRTWRCWRTEARGAGTCHGLSLVCKILKRTFYYTITSDGKSLAWVCLLVCQRFQVLPRSVFQETTLVFAPVLCKRCVDDPFSLFREKSHLVHFHNHLNSKHCFIKKYWIGREQKISRFSRSVSLSCWW